MDDPQDSPDLREFTHGYFRRLDTKLDRVLAELSDLKPRMTAVEVQLGYLTAAVGRTNERIDRVEVRLDLIGRRLDLQGDAAD
jgi:RNase P/RNase MRP subunit p30